MIKVSMDLMVFLRTTAPLLTSVIIFTLLFILLAKSIKKNPKVYYIVFSIPFLMYAIPTIFSWFGVVIPFSFSRVPVLGEIIRDYIHMGSLGHPLMIIIMYMGALDMKNPYVKRLMSIRKELSIISGFPILTHSLVRTVNNWPNTLKYFTNHNEFMDGPRVTSSIGTSISTISLFIGIIMLVLFLVLWITSFDSVHKRMGGAKWKQVQRWSYGLYAMMFIHAMGIQVGGLISRNAAMAQRAQRTELVAEAPQQNRQAERERTANPTDTTSRNRGERPDSLASAPAGENRGGERPSTESGARQQGGSPSTPTASNAAQGAAGAQAQGAPPRRVPLKGIPDIVVSSSVRSTISIGSLLLIYGSYLFLRIRKARKKKTNKNI